MSDPTSAIPADAVLHSEKLLGLESECPPCGETERSTGWLLVREDDPLRWYVHMRCTRCPAHGATWKRKWLPLIEEVLADERARSAALTTRPCTVCEGGGKCRLCGGTGVDVGVAVMAGHEGNCARCEGTGKCPVCDGSGRILAPPPG